MTPASVSFRITRSTEDLAQATHALSQRLVKLEQRLGSLEQVLAQAIERREHRDPEELSSLENVEQLLRDCHLLLGLEDDGGTEQHHDAAIAAIDPAPASAEFAPGHHREPEDHGDEDQAVAA